ncbi:hypothetical protein CBOM_02231 [Ceraceosorus bombacis]|uniref:Uncharacterized protein n=1 Tax=Ceraceosorus bombacis TaxID=401625 RepID=A0A0P1BFU4_9BASI|nr:hypothetical protein CBOM_02231 [Ceraceosorus bombacis]
MHRLYLLTHHHQWDNLIVQGNLDASTNGDYSIVDQQVPESQQAATLPTSTESIVKSIKDARLRALCDQALKTEPLILAASGLDEADESALIEDRREEGATATHDDLLDAPRKRPRALPEWRILRGTWGKEEKSGFPRTHDEVGSGADEHSTEHGKGKGKGKGKGRGTMRRGVPQLASEVDPDNLTALDESQWEHLTHDSIVQEGRKVLHEFRTQDKASWQRESLSGTSDHLGVYSLRMKNIKVRVTVCRTFDLQEALSGRSTSSLPKHSFSRKRTPTLHGGSSPNYDIILDRKGRQLTFQRWGLGEDAPLARALGSVLRPNQRREPNHESASQPQSHPQHGDNAQLTTSHVGPGSLRKLQIEQIAMLAESVDAREQEVNTLLSKHHNICDQHRDVTAKSSNESPRVEATRGLPLQQDDIRAQHRDGGAASPNEDLGLFEQKCEAKRAHKARAKLSRLYYKRAELRKSRESELVLLQAWAHTLTMPSKEIVKEDAPPRRYAHVRLRVPEDEHIIDPTYNVPLKQHRQLLLPFLLGQEMTSVLDEVRQTFARGFPGAYAVHNDVRLRELLNVVPKHEFANNSRENRETRRRRGALMAPWTSVSLEMPHHALASPSSTPDDGVSSLELSAITHLGCFTGAVLFLSSLGIPIASRPLLDVTILPMELCGCVDEGAMQGTRVAVRLSTPPAALKTWSRELTLDDFPQWRAFAPANADNDSAASAPAVPDVLQKAT